MDEIIALKCNKRHIYHVMCLENSLKKISYQRCALCREKIVLETNYENTLIPEATHEGAAPAVAAAF